jgi:hypothetical protein
VLNLFLDTEFTNFSVMTREVISIGLVSEDGKYEFYVENTSHHESFRSDFVNQTIMPMLDNEKYGMSWDGCCLELASFIKKLPDERINIIFDYSGDVDLVKPMLEHVIHHLGGKHITFELFKHALLRVLYERGVHTTSKIDDAFRVLFNEPEQGYFNTVDPRQHHALVDAKASRFAFQRALQEGLK